MAAARFTSDVLRMFYGGTTEAENRNPPRPLRPDLVISYDTFLVVRNNFEEWLRVWRMSLSEGNPNNKDLLAFARENKAKYVDLIENKIRKLRRIKVGFGMKGKLITWSTFSKKLNPTFLTNTRSTRSKENLPHLLTQ